MVRTRSFTVEEVFDFLEKYIPLDGPVRKKRASLNGCSIKVTSDRLRLFLDQGTTCVMCGIEGSVFWYEDRNSGNMHLNLYAHYWGEEILMTKDHIHPKSLGGKDHPDNYQVMCAECNHARSTVPMEEAFAHVVKTIISDPSYEDYTCAVMALRDLNCGDLEQAMHRLRIDADKWCGCKRGEHLKRLIRCYWQKAEAK